MDKRLMTCVSLCVGKLVADIGTDHGYLPCYMVKNELCESALACDIASKPLKSAQEHIKEQGLEDKIQTILTNGLEDVPSEGVTDIVIAGMGGEMISSILENCQWVKENRVNLVLQPMTKWDVLRKWLFDNGFEIRSEKACTEGKFVYSVMQAVYIGGKPSYECDMRYLFCGRVKAEGEDERAYIKRQAMRLETMGKGLLNNAEKAETANEMLRLAESLFKEIE